METPPVFPRSIILRLLLSALALAFSVGALTHAGVAVRLGVATIDEPTIVPAAVVEGLIAAALWVAILAELRGRAYAGLALRLALRAAIVGVLLGMFALALGRGQRTELNDVFHVVALISLLVAWQIAATGRAAGACRPGRRLARRAT